MKKTILIIITFLSSLIVFSQTKYDGLNSNMGNLYRLSDAKTRSISDTLA